MVHELLIGGIDRVIRIGSLEAILPTVGGLIRFSIEGAKPEGAMLI